MTSPPATDHRAEYDLASAAAERLRAEGFGDARALLQTGSGIPMPVMTGARSIPFAEIEGFPRASAPGHRGALHHGLVRDVPVIVLEGRLHCYEGHPPAQVIRPIRALGLLGIRFAVLTNATGGVRDDLRAGDVVRITDHVNLMGFDPMTGIHEPRFGDRFVVLEGRAHDRGLAWIADEAARSLGIPLAKGVYGGVHGPSFETAAQVRFLRAAGVDVVGMSTVPEIIAAAQMRMHTLVLSLVANPAGQVQEGFTAEVEVLEEGQRSGTRVARLVEEIVARVFPRGGAR